MNDWKEKTGGSPSKAPTCEFSLKYRNSCGRFGRYQTPAPAAASMRDWTPLVRRSPSFQIRWRTAMVRKGIAMNPANSHLLSRPHAESKPNTRLQKRDLKPSVLIRPTHAAATQADSQ